MMPPALLFIACSLEYQRYARISRVSAKPDAANIITYDDAGRLSAFSIMRARYFAILYLAYRTGQPFRP